MVVLVGAVLVAVGRGEEWAELRFSHEELDGEVLETQFAEWESKHRQAFAAEEREYRKAIWKTSFKMVEEHNARDRPYKLAMNEFAAMTPQEFHDAYLMQTPQPGCSATLKGGWKFQGLQEELCRVDVFSSFARESRKRVVR